MTYRTAKERAAFISEKAAHHGVASSAILGDDNKPSAFEIGPSPGCFDLTQGNALDAKDESAFVRPANDLAVGLADGLRVEAFGGSINFDARGAHAVCG